MITKNNIKSTLLLALYLSFFVSTNLCYHTHDLLGSTYSHSHFGHNADHTASQLLTISTLSVQTCSVQEATEEPAIVLNQVCELISEYREPLHLPLIYGFVSLRDPPFVG